MPVAGLLKRSLLGLLLLAVACGPTPLPTAGPTSFPPTPASPQATPTWGPPVGVDIPAVAWSRPLGLPFTEAGRSKTSYTTIDDGPFQGLPLGGLGAGTIGRTYRGDFARWHLDIGQHAYGPVWGDQFSVWVQQGQSRKAQVLYTGHPDGNVLSAWQWDYPVGAGTYYALYPFAWYDYLPPDLPVRLTVEQFSPILPGNYRETSYPIGIFLWTVSNPTSAPISLTVMLTWQDQVSTSWFEAVAGNVNRGREERTPEGRMVGVEMFLTADETPDDEYDGSLAIAALERPGLRLSYRSRFSAAGDGADVWQDLLDDGVLSNMDDPTPSDLGDPIGAALAVGVHLEAGEVVSFPMALAWDLPIMEFGARSRWYKKYTEYFGRDGRQAWAIAREGLLNYESWREEIRAWQEPVLADPGRPDWFKMALFNELYYLADGGTAWEAGRFGSTEPTPGHFAYLECFDYNFYNTFDVGFYSSWPLVMLWPDIEKTIIRDFATSIPQADESKVYIGYLKENRQRKLAGTVPHDMGSPMEDPWLRPNAFTWQDVNYWKDLNSKFILQLYRDYVFTGDRALVDFAWENAKQALAYLRQFDRNGDGIPENEGFPDQTYDTWSMKGTSAYVGSLWLAALEAAVEMARLEGDDAAQAEYAALLERSRSAFEETLWNGKYYAFDTDTPAVHDSIMADQLIGQWYAKAVGLPDIVPPEHARQALRTVYEYNVMRFQGGTMGAVNGMRPDGTIDTFSEQSQEVWVGTTYALAAGMYQEGLREEAWQTAWGLYNVTYVTRGLWFRTPEAWDKEGNFRASMYMRPQAIWALELAYRRGQCQ